jgi:Flp pilus assembly pilin Flp
MNLITYLRALGRNDKGQDLLEYALLVALIAIVCFVAVQGTGTEVNDIFAAIRTSLTPLAAPAAGGSGS